MKVLFVTHGADMMGANRCLIDLVEGLSKHNVKALILVPQEGELSAILRQKNIDYIISFYHNWAFTKYISKGYWTNFFRQRKNEDYVKEIISKIKSSNFDLIYTNSSITGIGAFIAEKLKLPHIWHVREFGEKDYGLSYWKGRTFFNLWANKSARILSMSKAIETEVLQNISVQTHVIYDGIISQKKFDQIATNQNHHKNPFIFLIIGLIHPTKNQFLALQAFHEVYKKNPNTQLLIVGKGRRLYTQKIKNYIKKNNLESGAKYLGYTKDPYKIHQQADCVLMCSKSEGMGRVTLEGMIFGNPVIGYNGGATPELIKHNETGLIYATKEELVESMSFLVENRDKAAEFGKKGRKAAEKYLIEYSAKEEYQIFQSVIDSQ